MNHHGETEAAVSVIVPCYRCAKVITRAVQSIIKQTVRPAEILLVDDASGDGTLDVLRTLERQHTGWIKVLELSKNGGPSRARNAGWAAATQPMIAFLDADDAWHPQKIERQYGFIVEHPEVALCGHAHRVLRHDELPGWPLADAVEAQIITLGELLRSNRFITPSVMLRRELQLRFAETQRHMEDHLLWLEIVCAGQTAVRLSDQLAAIYKEPFGEAGLSAALWEMGSNDIGNYWRLHRKGYLALVPAMGWCIFALLKFGRRLLLYWGCMKWR